VAVRGSRVPASLLMVVFGLVVLIAPSTLADSVNDKKRSVDAQILDLKEGLEGASHDLVDAAVRLKKLQAQLSDARVELAAARTARAEAMRKDAEVGARLDFAEAQLDKAEHEIETEQAAEAQTQETLGRIACETYVTGVLSGLSVALQASTPDQFTERLAAAGAALRAQGGALDRMAVVQAELRVQKVKLDAIRAQVAELKRQSAAVVVQRQTAESKAAAAEATVRKLVTDENAQVAAIRSKIAAEKARLGELEAEQAKLRATLVERAHTAKRATAHRRASGWEPPASGGFLSYPVPGSITSGFGLRYHPILHYYRMHTGVDFGAPCGTPVHAAADGDVISAGPAGGYGNRVVIDHGEVNGGDLVTTYNHLSGIVVRSGSVRRGQIIAYSGTTGLSTGCHLHFETLLDGRYVNPVNYL
jgi:murein DD-endopeptidase MepM/ murein hydrolase activator NlpD